MKNDYYIMFKVNDILAVFFSLSSLFKFRMNVKILTLMCTMFGIAEASADSETTATQYHLRRNIYLNKTSDIDYFVNQPADITLKYLLTNKKITQFLTLPWTKKLEESLLDYVINTTITKENFNDLLDLCDKINYPVHIQTPKGYEYVLKYQFLMDFGIKNIDGFIKSCYELNCETSETYFELTEKIRRNIAFWDEFKIIADSPKVAMVKINEYIDFQKYTIKEIKKIKVASKKVSSDQKNHIRTFMQNLYDNGGNWFPYHKGDKFNYAITFDGNVVYLINEVQILDYARLLQIVKVNVYYNQKGKMIISTSYKHDPDIGPQSWEIILTSKMSKAWSELLKKMQ